MYCSGGLSVCSRVGLAKLRREPPRVVMSVRGVGEGSFPCRLAWFTSCHRFCWCLMNICIWLRSATFPNRTRGRLHPQCLPSTPHPLSSSSSPTTPSSTLPPPSVEWCGSEAVVLPQDVRIRTAGTAGIVIFCPPAASGSGRSSGPPHPPLNPQLSPSSPLDSLRRGGFRPPPSPVALLPTRRCLGPVCTVLSAVASSPGGSYGVEVYGAL